MINWMFLIYVMLNAGAAWNMLNCFDSLKLLHLLTVYLSFQFQCDFIQVIHFHLVKLCPTQYELPENPIQITRSILLYQLDKCSLYIIYNISMIKLVKKVLPYFKSTWIYPRAKHLSGGGGLGGHFV